MKRAIILDTKEPALVEWDPQIQLWQDRSGGLWRTSELKFLNPEKDYWENMRLQYAGMALQGLLASNSEGSSQVIIDDAVWFADALIEKLEDEYR